MESGVKKVHSDRFALIGLWSDVMCDAGVLELYTLLRKLAIGMNLN